MKFNCQRETILREISDASDFTAQRNALTILSCVFLSLSGNTLVIKTTDQRMGFMSEITVDGIEDGSCAVICDKFLESLKALPEGAITFGGNEESFSMKPENRLIDFKIKAIDASAYPEMPIPSDEQFFKIAQKDFSDMINQVSFAVSDDESKYAMTGARLEKDHETGSLIMVGTDGRRLSFIKKSINTDIPDFEGITIPSKFLTLIKKHSLNEGSFDIAISPVSIFIKTGSCIIYSNLIKNEYPSYRRVIPENQTKHCVVNISDLEDAIKRASLLVESKYKKIILDFSETTLKIYTEGSDLGQVQEEISCIYDGEPQRSAMNYTYLLSPLKVMDGEKVTLAFTEGGRPFTVLPEPERDYLHVIMPMNLN